jgi:trans-aconitate methyltransferase
MIAILRRILTLPGFQFFATRFGGSSLRRISFDEKFRRGDWNFSPGAEFTQTLERYGNGGDILMLGCGSASVAGAMKSESYRSILGLDISGEAINRASKHQSDRIKFELGDMETFECPRQFDAILFSESLYYVGPFKRLPLLKRLAKSLTTTGVIIVTIAQPGRYSNLIEIIRREFDVVEDRKFSGSDRQLLVFR